ncbi:MAG: hypothetical protein ACT4P6_11830 [Gemmatimonadaceae bacterium]
MRSRAFVLVALAIAPTVMAAQSSPITRPKQSAQRAVDATNRHTTAMTTDTSVARTVVPATGNTSLSSRAGEAVRHTDSSASPSADTTRSRVTSKGATDKPERAQFEREIFSYERSGRRDPFISLMTSSDIRPLLPDLRLVGVAYDPTGRNSVAVLREDAQTFVPATPGARGGGGGGRNVADIPMYRVKEGQQLGRMRVARIGPKSVTFTIEEFGYSRQETLALSETNTEKKP